MRDTRTYRGLSSQERVGDRRERLLTAALQRFGTQGYPATTIDTLCADAKVSTRAFYECFTGREAILSALFEQIMAEAMAAVRTVLAAADDPTDEQVSADTLVSAGLAAYIGYMTTDERRARVAHAEVRRAGDPLHPSRRRSVHEFADLVADLAQGRTGLDDAEVHRVAIGLIGAIQELVIDWIGSEPRPPASVVLTSAEHIFISALSK